MSRNSILNRLSLQRSSGSKEIGYQNLKIDEPPGAQDAGSNNSANTSGTKTVTPSPNDHISSSQYIAALHSTHNSVSPPPPAHRHHHRKCPRWCRCLFWACLALVIVLVVVGLAGLIFYLVVLPKTPRFSIENVQIASLVLTVTDSNSSLSDYAYNSMLDMDLLLRIRAYNPNSRITVRYSRIRVDVSYQRLQLASTYIEPFAQGHKQESRMTAELVGSFQLQKFISRDLSVEMSDNAVNLAAQITVKAKLKVFKTVKPSMVAHIMCRLKVSPPTGPNGPGLLSKSCKLAKPTSKIF